MGKNIVRQESKDPGKRSRLWNSNDVYQVLKNNKGTHLIEGIKVDMSQIDNLLLSSLFENMFNLRYIHCYVPVHSWSYWCNKPPANGVSILSLPNELRYLRWEYYPFKSLPPSFNPKNLVVLKLNYGKMKRLWNEDNYKDIVNLRVIDVSDSENLKKIPSLVGAINLKSLNCSDCESLVELPRLAHLTSLEELRFRGCYNLTKFPELPDILSELDLSDTKIEEVPDSIQHLLRLELLCFRNCPIVKFPKIPRSIKLLDFSGTQIEEVSSSLDPLSKLEYLDMSFTLVQNVGSNILKLEYLKSLDLSYCPIVQFPEIEVPSPILTFKRLEYLTMVGCQSLELLSELPPDLKDLNAHGCTSLEDVSFTHQNLNSFDGEGYFFMIFWNCFNLNQYSISNIEANAMLKIQSLAEKCASRYDQEFSPKWEPKLICCFPGNKISANRFEYQSMNSFLSLEIAPSVNGVSRFLVFAICLVVDLTDCHCMADVEFICEYQLATASGFEKFRCELSPKPIHWPEQEGMGDHVLILCGKDMVRQDKNYVKASFEFRIKNREVERCGVHVFYVDAESYKITDVMRCDESNQNFDSQEDADIGGDEGDRGSKRLKNFHLEDATSR
ncbi:hypothetical protein V6N11_028275 [Hibiscus sabdariffa]|uniref:Uncharacterized protein n=2 Tax=Hibiscus sabdariffa TaxID=183260 RepID=A0ABR2NQL1_9ROSI